jgi:epoxyqueuosine reductase
VRNVLIAIGNAGDTTLIPSARLHLDDASPLVRGAAVWALSRLLPATEFTRLRAAHDAAETDADVRAEWTLAP